MTVRGTAVLLAVLAFGLGPVPSAFARSRSENAAATHAYIQANYALVRAARANLSAGQAALRSLVPQIASQCPRAAAESPQDHNSEQLSNEVVGALTIAAYRPDAAAIRVFDRAVAGLRWSSPTLTRLVKTYAARLKGLAALAMPNVCGDVTAWAANGYQALPPSSVEFDRRYYAVDIEAEEVPLRLLAPYESAGEASLVHRTKQLEAPLADAEADAVADYTRILDSLKLNP
jgi:hypothetical protein